MAGDPLWINANAGAPSYTANELREAMGLALMYDGRNMGVRKGVRPGGNQLFVSLAGSTITIQPGLCALDPGLTTLQGSYWVCIPVAETQTFTAADVTNPRKDIVIARVYDHDEDASGLRLARTEYLVGTPNPSPAEPALPASAIKLALIDVPLSGGGAAVVTDKRPWTVATGGILPVAVAGDITAGTEGRYRDRLDTNLLERDSGAAWETAADPQQFKAWTSAAPTWTAVSGVPAVGNGTLTGRYLRLGKTVDWEWTLTAGSTTTYGNAGTVFFFTIPGGGVATSYFHGSGWFIDASTSNSYILTWRIDPGVSAMRIWRTAAGVVASELTNTSPVTLTTGDSITCNGTIEIV